MANTQGGKVRRAAISRLLENPRHTGYQVWNQQRRDEVLIDVTHVGLGHQTKMRWNDQIDWIWSDQPSQEAIVSREEWEREAPGTTTAPTAKERA